MLVGGGLAAINLRLPLQSMLGKPVFFGEIYANSDPYFTFQIHLVISLIFACQLALYLLAIATPYLKLKR